MVLLLVSPCQGGRQYIGSTNDGYGVLVLVHGIMIYMAWYYGPLVYHSSNRHPPSYRMLYKLAIL
jgi:hypothetical protein